MNDPEPRYMKLPVVEPTSDEPRYMDLRKVQAIIDEPMPAIAQILAEGAA